MKRYKTLKMNPAKDVQEFHTIKCKRILEDF